MVENRRIRHGIIRVLTALLTAAGCTSPQDGEVSVQFGSMIYPDYTDVTVPVNIAPLNFRYTDAGMEKVTTVFTSGELSVTFHGRDVQWNMRKWRKLTQAAAGSYITVKSSPSDTTWRIYVSREPIDYGLAYRLIEPGYEVYSSMGIYERELSTFRERPVIENTDFDGCVNCHSFNRCDPSDLSLHIRGPHGATLLRRGGRMDVFDTGTDSTLGFCVYPYWHPSGRYIAYSTNTTRQSFHVRRDKLVEVFDNASDLQVYDVERNTLITAPQVKTDTLWETFPAFSPDGNTIYFCRARARSIPLEVEQIRYDLCSVSFDPVTGTIGNDVETVIDASSMGKSISFPRVSFDGRFLMYTLIDYGQFSIWHHEADLWLLDLSSGENRPLDEVNSPDTESYHNFSSGSRWFVFSSRRDDGLFTRPYIAHIDENGIVGKAFMLPQKDPWNFYSGRFLSFNVPEFITSPISLDRKTASGMINAPERKKFGFRWSE